MVDIDDDADDAVTLDPSVMIFSTMATKYHIGTIKWLKELGKCKLQAKEEINKKIAVWFGMIWFCRIHKTRAVPATELHARKYIHARFYRLLGNTLRCTCNNPIRDYSKLNVTFSAMKVANFILENGKLCPGKSFN